MFGFEKKSSTTYLVLDRPLPDEARLPRGTFISLLPSVASAIAAIVSAYTAVSALKLSAQQSKITRDAMIFSNRPWLSVGLVVSSGFERHEDGSLFLTVEGKSANVGRSPALRVSSSISYDYSSVSAYEAMTNLCHLDESKPLPVQLFYHQQSVWPGETLPQYKVQMLFKANELSNVDTGANSKLLFIVNCIEYQISGDTHLHHSAGAWRLIKLRKDGPGNEGFPVDRSTPSDEILLQRGWGGEAEYAD